MSMLKKTPLYNEHVSLDANMGMFAGWHMPIFYNSIIQEHLWTRENVSIFDICHMGEFLVKGDLATDFLNKMLTNDIRGLQIGQCRYNLMLNPEGYILDDLIVYKFSEFEYMMVVNAATTLSDFNWLISNAPSSVKIEDISAVTAKIDVQGPNSLKVISEIFMTDFYDLKYFRFKSVCWQDLDLIISRTGYTGELGYEIYVPADKAPLVWRALLDFCDVKPAGLGARDTLRLEVGYPLYGQDISKDTTPIEANLERFVYWEKDFIGKNALLKSKDVNKRLVGIKSDTRRPFRHGSKITSVGTKEEIGYVTSGSFSPCLQVAIGLAYIDSGFKEGDEVCVEARRPQKAILSPYPFYSAGSVRVI